MPDPTTRIGCDHEIAAARIGSRSDDRFGRGCHKLRARAGTHVNPSEDDEHVYLLLPLCGRHTQLRQRPPSLDDTWSLLDISAKAQPDIPVGAMDQIAQGRGVRLAAWTQFHMSHASTAALQQASRVVEHCSVEESHIDMAFE